MKSHLNLLLAMVVLWIGSATEAKYSGGTGEPNDPYRIATAEDLNDIGNHTEDFDKHFILVNDVNLAQYTDTQFKIIGNYMTEFTGVFDGNDHKVWNFTWASGSEDIIGLFRYVTEGEIKNLGMENVDVNFAAYSEGYKLGGLVGYNYLGLITNCYSTGKVSGRCCGSVGGLVGENYKGTITNCYSTGSASGKCGVGGLVGENYKGTITNCYSAGSASGESCVGGLVGRAWRCTITDCYSAGSVSGKSDVGGLSGLNECGTITNCYSTGSVTGTKYVGGLVGSSSGTIINCYSMGSVTGTGEDCSVGGLVGTNDYYYDDYYQASIIINCYSTGSVTVTGDYCSAGGLVGENSGSTITNCYSTGNVTGTGDCSVRGLVGSNYYGGTITDSFWDVETSGQSTSKGGIGKTTAEMKTMSTFTDAGWDFVEIWGIGEYQTYPFLLTEPAGDSNHDEKVNLLDLAILASHWLEGLP